MLRRLLLTATATAACVLGGAAGAAAAPYSLLQVNLCGSGLAPCFGMGSSNKAGKAAELIRARRPSVVTLNEMCSNDLATIRRATGFNGHFIRSGSQKCKNKQEYGNAVMFAPGVRVAVVSQTTYLAQQRRGDEKRTLLCVDGGGVRVCVTHLDSGGLQGQQAQQMESTLANYADAGVRTLLGGDWNLKFGGNPNAQNFVPGGMFRKGDNDVQHVMATQKHFRFVSTRTMRLNWTDHPGFQVYFDKR
ncbi:MAG: hypothetical protein M3417_14050 [Actinomycetota bacterium]|nr:hypothetical protein [Actinomycetota bacterium]